MKDEFEQEGNAREQAHLGERSHTLHSLARCSSQACGIELRKHPEFDTEFVADCAGLAASSKFIKKWKGTKKLC